MKLKLNHNIATWIQTIAAAVGLAGICISDFLPNSIWWRLSSAVFLFLVCAVAIVRREKQIHTFETGSTEFVNFFEIWYKQEGTLIIYCNDLDWAQPNAIKNALTIKATNGNLSLYLKDIGFGANDLKKLGAKLYVIPHSSNSLHKFSILQNDGFEKMICRRKHIEPTAESKREQIEFFATTNTRDPHIIALALDVLSNCTIQA